MTRSEQLTSDFPPPASPLRAVTFDFDGLMFNTEELYQEVGGEILGKRGHTFEPDLIDRMMGRKSHEALAVMIEWFGLAATPQELAAESAALFVDLLPRRVAPMPGMIELLNALEAAGVPKAIATSSGQAFVAAVLDLFDWHDRFAFILTSEDIDRGKPAPDVYLLAARRHGVLPAAMLVLEDSQLGCQAAVASGAYTVAVPSGRSLTHRFPGVAFVADSLIDDRIYAALQVNRANGDPP